MPVLLSEANMRGKGLVGQQFGVPVPMGVTGDILGRPCLSGCNEPVFGVAVLGHEAMVKSMGSAKECDGDFGPGTGAFGGEGWGTTCGFDPEEDYVVATGPLAGGTPPVEPDTGPRSHLEEASSRFSGIVWGTTGRHSLGDVTPAWVLPVHPGGFTGSILVGQPVPLLEIPTKTTSSCRYEVTGNTDVCATPYLNHQDMEDFAALDVDALGANINVRNVDASTEELIRTAWALLKQNDDLARWAMCWYWGPDSDGETEMLGRLWADGTDYNYVDIIGRRKRKQFWGYRDWGGGGRILFPLKGIGTRYMDAWRNARDDQDRMCVAVDLAATLLHELTHVCNYFGGDESGKCDGSYLIENNFRWAMFQRYSHATEGACCGEVTTSDCFMSDEETYLDCE